MLVLKRRPKDIFEIISKETGQKIIIKIIKTGKNSVFVGVDAPVNYRVERKDVINVDKK